MSASSSPFVKRRLMASSGSSGFIGRPLTNSGSGSSRPLARCGSGSAPMLGRGMSPSPSVENAAPAKIVYQPGAIKLADIACPQPDCRIHPNATVVNQQLKDWTIDMLKPFELGIEDYIDEYNTMAAYVFGDASDERLTVIGKLSNLQYVHDDMIDGRRIANASGPYASALQTLAKQPKVLLAGCRDIMYTLATAQKPASVAYGRDVEEMMLLDYYLEAAEGFHRLSNPAWMKRFSKNLKIFYESQVNSASKPQSFSSCAEFVDYRAANSGMLHSIDEVEFAQDNFMPTEILEHAVIKEMQQNVILVGSLSNDIFSFEKETIRDGMHHANLVHVAMTTEGLSIEQGAKKTAAIVRDNMDTFYRLKAEVDSWNMPNVSRHCVGLENFLLGCWPWQLSTDRYRSETSPFAELLLPKTVAPQPNQIDTSVFLGLAAASPVKLYNNGDQVGTSWLPPRVIEAVNGVLPEERQLGDSLGHKSLVRSTSAPCGWSENGPDAAAPGAADPRSKQDGAHRSRSLIRV
eukprot:TRINITY_DN787_c0_g1_i2.p1 TRINITY_DN787_c0_g1~~TRINITY_DN787_c0_g1_i2.p1  ORF type:complete len:519 (-),score=210.52 TRINITY_DN787_c0_g1_i2:466-2022(-)